MAGDDLLKARETKKRMLDVKISGRKARSRGSDEDERDEEKQPRRGINVRAHISDSVTVRDASFSEDPSPDPPQTGGKKDIRSRDAASSGMAKNYYLGRRRRARKERAAGKSGSSAKEVLERLSGAARGSGAVKAGAALLVLAATVITIASVMTMAVSSSPFGVLLSAEDAGGISVRQAISDIMQEHQQRIGSIEQSVEHDEVVYDTEGGLYAVRWEEILSVYAVILSQTDETVTMDQDRQTMLRDLFFRMCRVGYSIEEEEGDEGQRKVLIITLSLIDADEMAERLGLGAEQRDLINEMLSDDYTQQWARLTGNWRQGGQIMIPASGWRALGRLSWPLADRCRLTSYFGYRSDPFTGERKFHGGIDLACPEGTPVIASSDGTVEYVNALDPWGYGYGYHVILEHGNGLRTLYGHCSAVSVYAGQHVVSGEVIAYVGSTGNSTGDHLHFEVRRDGQKENPLSYFAAE